MTKFVHLHNHSHYSLLDGASPIDKMVARAKELDMDSLALTDHGNLHGALKFYRECKKQGIKPILGYEAYMAQGKRTERDSETSESYHLTILAKNRTGWNNLVKLASTAFLDGFYYRPRIDREILSELKEGLIVLSGCLSSELSRACLINDPRLADEIALWYAKEFGDDFYLEIMHNGSLYQARCTQAIIDCSLRLSLPLVCTSDCHYVNPNDNIVQDAMVCISTGRTRNSPKESPRLEENTYYLRAPLEMSEIFYLTPDAVSRTQEIADQIDLEIETGVRHFPVFSCGKETKSGHLRRLCYEGLKARLGPTNSHYTGRLEDELKIIHDLGFSEYFLIVADFCGWAKQRGIFSSARGSGVGSLVCFVLGISHIDPIENNLLFERFLDPSRREAPDLDIDFDKERRAEVISYVREKYGEECVAQIGTFGTLGARSAIKDVGRVECLLQTRIQEIVDLIPELPGTTLEDALEKVPELSRLLERDKKCEWVFNLAKRLEGMAKSRGVHAAGVVIGDKPLTCYLPLARGKDGSTVTQWDMDDCEAVGLLKIDLLGLRNLTILSRAIRIIEETTGKQLDIHKIQPSARHFDDSKVWELLQRGETKGIFQLEGPGMTDLLMRLEPTCIEHICACIALYRPGPLDSGMVDHYVARKKGTELVPSIHPIADSILSSTYGVPIYQESIMMLANKVAGIPLSDAYSLIKAIGRKIKDKVDAYKTRFVWGCKMSQVSSKDIETLWSVIEASARYLFNRSHSMAYAYIAYQTAFLKAYFPIEFMAALLSCDISQRNFTGRDPLVEHVGDCRRMGIEVVPPCINTSGPDFQVRDNKIYFGLDAIKGIPHSAGVAIQQFQPFTDLFDFAARVPKSACPRAAIRNLARVSAIPGTENRATIEATIDRAMKLAAGEYAIPGKQIGKWTHTEALTRSRELESERELTGLYLSGHPFEKYPDLSLLTIEGLDAGDGVAAGVVTTIETRFTHAGKKFVTFCLDLPRASTSCLIWEPNNRIMEYVKDGNLVVCRGTVNHRGSENTLVCRSIRMPEEYTSLYKIGIHILMESNSVASEITNMLCDLSEGPSPVFVSMPFVSYCLLSRVGITLSQSLIDELRAIPGCRVYFVEVKKHHA